MAESVASVSHGKRSLGIKLSERSFDFMTYVTLSNGVKMPQLGYGVYQVTKEECERCVLDALKTGYSILN